MQGKILLALVITLMAGLATTGYALATPSSAFYEKDGDVFDEWEISRTRAFGADGFYQISETTFRPVIAFESLGENAALAYSLGKQMAARYPNQIQRAEAVFNFVRDRISYTSDIDQFKYEEYAQNADELAMIIDADGIGYGDCEDSTVLLAVMYKGAGFRSAIVVGSGHTAALVYLPEYKKATAPFEIGGETGWIWAEATGKNNPLGWVPKDFIDVELAAYEISEEAIGQVTPNKIPQSAVTRTGGGGGFILPFPFFGVIGLLWLFSLLRRRRAAS